MIMTVFVKQMFLGLHLSMVCDIIAELTTCKQTISETFGIHQSDSFFMNDQGCGCEVNSRWVSRHYSDDVGGSKLEGKTGKIIKFFLMKFSSSAEHK
jgi:hypothetical protein